MSRPREHDRDQVALDMINWAQLDTSINLNEFCAINKMSPSMIIRWSKENDLFRQSYELVKAHLAWRRENWLNSEALHVKAYDLNATNYDMFLRDERRAQAEFEAGLKLQTDSQVPEVLNEKVDLLMKQLSDHKSHSACKTASNNSKSE